MYHAKEEKKKSEIVICKNTKKKSIKWTHFLPFRFFSPSHLFPQNNSKRGVKKRTMNDHTVLGCTAAVGGVLGCAVFKCLASRSVEETPAAPAKKVGSVADKSETTVTVTRDTQKEELTWKQGKDGAAWRTLRTKFSIDACRVMELKRGDTVFTTFAETRTGDTFTLSVEDSNWRDLSNQLRKDGNARFTRGNQTGNVDEYVEALRLYRRAYQILPPDGGDDASRLFCLAKSNCAQICLKCDKLDDCRAVCSEVLKRDPRNTKALYRRGVAAKRLSPQSLTVLV